MYVHRNKKKNFYYIRINFIMRNPVYNRSYTNMYEQKLVHFSWIYLSIIFFCKSFVRIHTHMNTNTAWKGTYTSIIQFLMVLFWILHTKKKGQGMDKFDRIWHLCVMYYIKMMLFRPCVKVIFRCEYTQLCTFVYVKERKFYNRKGLCA